MTGLLHFGASARDELTLNYKFDVEDKLSMLCILCLHIVFEAYFVNLQRFYAGKRFYPHGW